ncbi:MAG: phosphohistidine phosphatase SixA [Anaerolineales bacterium]
MNVMLVQHAEALAEEEDPDRPLSAEGVEQLRKVASIVALNRDLDLARIWHSGKTRSAQTAEILADHFRPRLGVRSAEGLSPLDDPRMWADRLAEMEQQVMLVGHLPNLEKLAALLLTGQPTPRIIAFQNAGIVCFRYQDGAWRLRWAVTPESIGAS